MKRILSIALVSLSIVLLGSCKKGCMECSGITAPREYCEDDYSEKSDYENEIDAYVTAGGVCEEN